MVNLEASVYGIKLDATGTLWTMNSLLLLVSITFVIVQVSTQSNPSCDSKIYCQGDLLHTVQMAKIFNDSKTFVDMSLVNTEEVTLANFEKFMNDTHQNPSTVEVEQFVKENFHSGNEFEDWVPVDYTDSPEFLSRVEDESIRNFGQALVKIWPLLARKMKQEVLDSPDRYTLLPVEHGFIIPGGRFREFYYWDSYWIVRGLLLGEMYDTVRGMLDNFLSLVERYGFVPNGARIYYLNRSQPPLLSAMVAAYIEATNDTSWLKNNIRTLDKELRFWVNNRMIEVVKDDQKYDLYHYDSESGSPRPESYSEDTQTASFFQDEDSKIQLYADLKSGAESGHDFSSRWIVNETGGNLGNLTMLKTRRMIPVDLNAFLCQAFRILSQFYVIVHDFDNANFWLEKSLTLQKAIEEVLYHEEDGIWYDWDTVLARPRRFFLATNFAPLWSDAYDPSKAEVLGKRAAEYFVNQDIMRFQGGIPTSLSQTGEQWDYPNAWPPLQAIVVFGLDRSGNCDAKNLAKEFANRWVTANLIGFNTTNDMFEKYDAEHPGQYGSGGEYTTQTGFGWTNGVVLQFIDRFFTTPKKLA